MQKKLLLIDDDANQLDMMSGILQQELTGFDIECEKDAQRALEKVLSQEYALVVCDYRMPEATALDVLQKIKEGGKDVPFVVVSASGNEKAAVELMKKGAYDYLVKDSMFNDMLPIVIKNTLERHAAEILRIKADNALRESEMRFRSISRSAGDLLWEVDPKGVFTYCSEKTVDIFGYPADEVLGKTPFDFMNEEEKKRVAPIVEAAFRKKEPLKDLENYYVHKDGSIHCLITNGMPILDEKGAFKSYVGVCRDITEQKKAEEELKALGERFRLLFEHAPDGMYLADIKGRFLDGNREAERIIGYKKEELIGRSFLEFGLVLSPKDVAKAAQLLAMNLMGKATGPDIMTLKRRNGTTVPVEITTHPLRLGGKRVLLGIARDISKRIAMEEAVRIEQAKARRYIDVAGVLFIAVDRKGCVTLVNKKACEVFGYSEREMLGRNWIDNFLPSEVRPMVRAAFKEIVKTKDFKKVDYFENPVLTKTGDKRLIAWHNVLITDDAGEALSLLLSGEDITERRKMEDDLKKSRQNYETIFHNFPFVAFITDRYARIIDANKYSQQLTGLSLEKCKGKRFSALSIGFSRQELLKGFMEFRKNLRGEVTAKTVYRVRFAGGDERYIELVGIPIKERGKVTRVLIAGSDVTQAHLASQRITKAYETMYKIIESAPFGIFVVKDNGRIESVNQAMLAISGDNLSQFKQINVFELSSYQAMGLSEKIKQAVNGERFQVDGVEYISSYGKKKTICNFIGIPLEIGKKALVIVEDTTQRKDVEDELKKKISDLERFNKVAIGRELTMIELKRKIKKLEKELESRK